jgi:hypothetical protein
MVRLDIRNQPCNPSQPAASQEIIDMIDENAFPIDLTDATSDYELVLDDEKPSSDELRAALARLPFSTNAGPPSNMGDGPRT